MAKISFTGKQYTITVPKDLMEAMGWDKQTEIIIGKYPDKDILFLEKIKREEDHDR